MPTSATNESASSWRRRRRSRIAVSGRVAPYARLWKLWQPKHIGRGFHTGVYNSRGVHLRGEGGDQERELAVKYRKWAQETAPDYSFVSSVLANLASSYERDAEREDSEARVNRRLRH